MLNNSNTIANMLIQNELETNAIGKWKQIFLTNQSSIENILITMNRDLLPINTLNGIELVVLCDHILSSIPIYNKLLEQYLIPQSISQLRVEDEALNPNAIRLLYPVQYEDTHHKTIGFFCTDVQFQEWQTLVSSAPNWMQLNTQYSTSGFAVVNIPFVPNFMEVVQNPQWNVFKTWIQIYFTLLNNSTINTWGEIINWGYRIATQEEQLIYTISGKEVRIKIHVNECIPILFNIHKKVEFYVEGQEQQQQSEQQQQQTKQQLTNLEIMKLVLRTETNQFLTSLDSIASVYE